jgi:hypothetical protein
VEPPSGGSKVVDQAYDRAVTETLRTLSRMPEQDVIHVLRAIRAALHEAQVVDLAVYRRRAVS